MSDIDFDELDRAVTSVLNSPAQKPAEPAAAPAPEPVVATKPVAASAQDLHPAAQRPVQRGRFLDMVHPAHDMAPRQAVAIAPAERPNAVASQSTSQTFVSDVVAEPTPSTVVPKPEQPVETPQPAASAPEAPAPEAKPEDFFAGGPVDAKPTEPTPSPFIPDAKVEKRPLGAFAVADSATLPVGEELHDKLVAVESEDNVVETGESSIPARQETAIAPKPATTPVKPVTPVTPISAATNQDEPMHLAKNRLDKPPKHGKGTLIWVVVLIAVLLIGGGVGASLYFLVLQ